MGFQRVLLPLGACGPPLAAVQAATRSVELGCGQLRLVHVRTWSAPPPPPRESLAFTPGLDFEAFHESAEQAAELIDAAVGALAGRGVPADAVVVEAHRSMVADAIIAAATAWHAELIVMCHRPRRPASAWLRGSVSGQVMRESPCPVLVARRPA